MTNRRRSLFVEPEVQGAIVRRVLLYWLCCLLFINLPLLIGQVLANPDQYFYQQISVVAERHWPTYLCLIAILPFLVYDAMKISNRFVGPIVRIQNELARLADGTEPERPVHFRDADYWQQVGMEFNRVADRIRELNDSTPQDPADATLPLSEATLHEEHV
ncbi:MAG: hypothetical protein KDA87_18965 [Planctomycetales bacterium]|nr:hypothetical protein [Planctomycetales bacterium]